MKRSEINRRMKEALAFLKERRFVLPPFVFWTPEEWKTKGREYDEIRRNMLGWDITDFGSGDFEKIGLLLITLRNGNPHDASDKKPYAEKLLLVEEGQITPFHFHNSKMEDIINRGGGNLICKLYNSTADGGLADTDVEVRSDGRRYRVPAGTEIRLTPGESITLSQGQYHCFWAEPGHGKVMLTEVSMVNDDHTDNRFLEKTGRFPPIEEDEAPLYLLAIDYEMI